MSQPFVRYPFLIIHLQKANYLLINQFREVNFIYIVHPLSFKNDGVIIFVDYYAAGLIKQHIKTIVTKLTDTQKVMFKTIYTLLIEIEELPIVPVPMILPNWLPPNFTFPPSFIARVRNIDFSPVMCLEHPLSRYHDLCFSFALRHICNIDTFRFRYPLLCGSFGVSTGRFTLHFLYLVILVPTATFASG